MRLCLSMHLTNLLMFASQKICLVRAEQRGVFPDVVRCSKVLKPHEIAGEPKLYFLPKAHTAAWIPPLGSRQSRRGLMSKFKQLTL